MKLWSWALACSTSTVQLGDANNFQYSAQLQPAALPLEERADSSIHWDALSGDLVGQPIAPEEIETIELMVFSGLELDELLDGLVRDTVRQSSLDLYLSAEPTHPVRFSDFALQGDTPHPEQYFEQATGIWLVAWSGLEEGVPVTRRLLLLEPTPGGPEEAELPAEGGELTPDADFSTLRAVEVPAGQVPALDWSSLSVNAQGQELALQEIDRLRLTQLEASSPQELAEDFVTLESRILSEWTLDLQSTTRADLADLQGDAPFTGFEAEGTWLLSLSCVRCGLPVPSFLTIVEVI